jgi:hypothetical protein
LSYIVTSLPGDGDLNDPGAGLISSVPYTLVADGNQVVYVPDANYTGSDSFQFVANDGGVPPSGGDSNIATVTVNVQFLPTIIYETDFEGGLPDGWSIVDGYSDGRTWTSTNPGGRSSIYWTGIFMIVDSRWNKQVNMDEQLVTDSIDCSMLQDVTLKFKHEFVYNSGEVADVDVRVDGGPWQNVAPYQSSASGLVELDISSIADGQTGVQIRWHYYDARREWYWGIDDVEVTAVNLQEPVTGDFDGDYDVDLRDFAVLALAWQSSPGDDNWNPICDISQPADDVIDTLDLSVFTTNWLKGTE